MPGSEKCVKPFHMPPGQPLLDLEHSWETAQAAYNHGTMDGFVWAEGSPYTMGYYDQTDIPNYWHYAAPVHAVRPLFLLRNDREFAQPRLHRGGAVRMQINNIGTLDELEDELDDAGGIPVSNPL